VQHFTQLVMADDADPVELMAGKAIDNLMDSDWFMEAANQIVFREMGMHPKTVVGGDCTDLSEQVTKWLAQGYTIDNMPDYIMESDSRFDLYFERLSNLTNQVIAQMIASQKYRWTKAFSEAQNARN
jgi:hypothetical protein